MRIINRTHYDTEAMRRLFAAGLRHLEAPSVGKVVTVVYTRPGPHRRAHGGDEYVSGHAAMGRRYPGRLVHGRSITMCLPKDPARLDVGKVARVWDHEVRHTMGVGHRSMTKPIREASGPTPAWADGLTLPVRVVEQVPVVERRAAAVATRAAHALEMLDRWTRRRDRAVGRVKTWAAKVKRYQRAGVLPATEKGE